MAALFLIVGAVLQVVGVGVLLVNVRAIHRSLRRRDAVARPATVQARAYFPPVRAIGTGVSLEVRVEQLEQGLWTLREDVHNLEVKLQGRLSQEIAQTRQQIEAAIGVEVESLRTLVVGRPPFTVPRLLFASIGLIAAGVIASMIGSLLSIN